MRPSVLPAELLQKIIRIVIGSSTSTVKGLHQLWWQHWFQGCWLIVDRHWRESLLPIYWEYIDLRPYSTKSQLA
ncbi:hypothetical protein HDU91_006970, partial [Kappamyces sp. JEL0680]